MRKNIDMEKYNHGQSNEQAHESEWMSAYLGGELVSPGVCFISRHLIRSLEICKSKNKSVSKSASINMSAISD